MAEEKIFKGLIKCGCGKRFTPIKENNRIKYICSDYHRSKGCFRNVWSEADVMLKVEQHLSRHNLALIYEQQYMKDTIKQITIYDSERYKIEFKNGVVCGYESGDNNIFTL